VQDGSTPPPLKIAPRVTRRHGKVFAAEWFLTSHRNEHVWEAFAETELIEWPEGGLLDPAQARYQDIEDEILERAFASIRPAVAEEFVKVAQEVLARERRRQ
jgi:hypothetical protein